MKSISLLSALAALAAASPVAQQASSTASSSSTDTAVQAAVETNAENVNATAVVENVEATTTTSFNALETGFNQFDATQVQDVNAAQITQLILDQAAQLCGANFNAGFGNVNAAIATQTVLIQGLNAAALQTVVPFFGGAQAFVQQQNVFNNGFANAGLINLNSLNQIPGAFIDPVQGLQVVEVIQDGFGTVGIAPIVQGLAISQGVPIIQNGQLLQILDINQAFAQGIDVNSLAVPVLVNGQLQQIFPIDQNLLLNAAGLLGNLNLISGVNVAAIPFNVANNQLWNFQGGAFQQFNAQIGAGFDANALAQLGLLNAGVANINALSIGNPFFIQSNSFFNSGSAVLGVPPVNAINANQFGATVFLVADQVIDFNQLANLQIAQQIALSQLGVNQFGAGFGGVGVAGFGGVF